MNKPHAFILECTACQFFSKVCTCREILRGANGNSLQENMPAARKNVIEQVAIGLSFESNCFLKWREFPRQISYSEQSWITFNTFL